MQPTAKAVGINVSENQAPLGAKDTNGAFITLARVIKTQGRHGEVAAEIHSDVPERFAPGMKLFALAKDESRHELEIEDLWPHKGLLVLKFQGVDSMNDAETLIGAELQVPREQRAELEQGWTYVSDLIGCTVFDSGKEIGRIADIQFGAGEAPLLIVEREGKKYDIPFAEAYLEGVDVTQRRVNMRLPEGMLEINQPMTPEEKQEQRLEGRKSNKL
ncbi:MAG TPA: ribosome maturation factor RimM [Candidatus Solibacter sp.]|nr:ribosome maturation factor RimM [Candidatus Solibacter sp.]